MTKKLDILIYSLLFLAFLYAGSYIVGSYENFSPKGMKVEFYKKKIREKSPEVIFIGNSMVGKNILEEKFENDSGFSALKIHQSGVFSPLWYLTLKNIIIPEEDKPEIVYIFYRDYNILDLHNRVYGKFQERLEEFFDVNEEYLKAKLYSTDSYPKEIYRKYEVNKENFKTHFVSKNLRFVAFKIWKYFSPDDARSEGVGYGAANYYFHKSFANRRVNFNMVKEIDQTFRVIVPDPENFDKLLKNSLLSEIIEMAQNNNINLKFVRVKRNENAHKTETFDSINKYKFTKKLEEYLNQEGFELIDFTYDKDFKKEHFDDDDGHLNDVGQKIITKKMAEITKDFLRDL